MTRVVVLLCLTSWLAALNANAQSAGPPAETHEVAQPMVIGDIAPNGKAPVVAAAREMTLTERLLLRQQWMAYREHDRRAVGLAGPIIGLSATLGVLGMTSWMLTSDNQQVQVSGGVLTGVLLVPLITASIWVLTTRVKKRRAIYREIWGAPPVRALPLAWRFWAHVELQA